MGILGKVAPIVTILVSLGTAFFAYQIATERSGYEGQLAGIEKELKSGAQLFAYDQSYTKNANGISASINAAVKKFTDSTTAQQDAESKYDEAQKQLADVNSQVQTLTTELASTKKQFTSADKELKDVKSSLASTSSELETLKKELQGEKPAELLSRIQKKDEDYKILQAEKNILDDRVVQMASDLQKARELIDRKDSKTAPLSLTGKVVAINPEWNFVVLNVGTEQRLVEGVDLTLYRGNDLIGKVRTVSVDANTAIADILPDWKRGEVQVGDQVIF